MESPAPFDGQGPNVEVVADGAFRRLDPAFLPASRLAAGLVTLGLAVAGSGALALAWLWGVSPPVLYLAAGPGISAVVAVHAGTRWFAARHFASTDYALGPDGIVIRHGIVWRSIGHVPRSRIQHTDVTQGPIERRFGLGTLVLHTAGTHHARVELAGLAYPVAARVRDDLLTGGGHDAI